MNTNIITDVIIVGAGPTGLSLACQLVRYGIDFVIIEKKAGVTTHSKAIGVQARTMEIYEQLGVVTQALVGGASPLENLGQIAGKIRIIANSKVRGEVDLSAMGKGLSPYPYLFILEQSKNEQLLYDYLQSHDREVLWQTELEHFTQSEMGVTAQVKTADGGSKTIAAKYLIGCDGAKSPVRHELGLTFEGSTLERLYYVVDAQIDWEFSADAGYGCISRDSLTFLFPMAGEKRYRIVGTFPESFDQNVDEISYETIEQRIQEDTKLSLAISNVKWFSVYKVNTRAVNKFSVGRCFVAGDAAHVHSPAGGQGMNTGIQDAYNLAWKMAFVIKGYASEKLLATYNEERLPNAQRLLETTDRAFNVLVGSNWFFSFMRMKILPLVAKYAIGRDVVGKNIFSAISQIRINYRTDSLSNHNGDEDFKVKAGDRMPYFLVDGKSVYDWLHAPKFHLLVFSDSEHEVRDLGQELEHESGDSIDFKVIMLNQHIVKIFGVNRPFQLLLRPDNYIGFISTEASLAKLKAYMYEISEYSHLATISKKS
jgi:2-polyprenyl-6-methoxyphenol hydroxylase-like FAD-dependent oxidoreductase